MKQLPISRALDDLEGLTWALDCVVNSIETRGRATDSRDSLASIAITDAMFELIEQLKEDHSDVPDARGATVAVNDPVPVGHYSFGSN